MVHFKSYTRGRSDAMVCAGYDQAGKPGECEDSEVYGMMAVSATRALIARM